MTDAIEAGARAFLNLPMSIGGFGAFCNKASAECVAKVIIEAAIASGALVPASAVAGMRERCALAVRDVCDTQAKGWEDNPGDGSLLGHIAASNCGVFAEQAIRQIDLAPARTGGERPGSEG